MSPRCSVPCRALPKKGRGFYENEGKRWHRDRQGQVGDRFFGLVPQRRRFASSLFLSSLILWYRITSANNGQDNEVPRFEWIWCIEAARVGWVWLRYPNEKIVIRRICRSSLSYRGYRILYILSRGSHWRAETGSATPQLRSRHRRPSGISIKCERWCGSCLRRACEVTCISPYSQAQGEG